MNPPSSSSNLLEEARTVNSSLSRVQQTLSWTVQQTEHTKQVLTQDQTVLTDALHDHKYELATALASTKKRLDRLKSAERYERVLSKLSMGLFMAVIGYILLSRLRVWHVLWTQVYCLMSSGHSEL